MLVVSDTSPITALLQTGLDHLLPELFQRVIIPPAGYFEKIQVAGALSIAPGATLSVVPSTAVYDWPFGATIATVLVVIVVGVNLASMRLLDGRRRAPEAA